MILQEAWNDPVKINEDYQSRQERVKRHQSKGKNQSSCQKAVQV